MMALDNPIEWTCFSRTDLWDGTLLERMSQAGCRSILFGVESGNEEVLARTQKGISLPQVELFVLECRRVGIDTVASFIIGLPLESTERIQQTIDFAQRLNPTYAQFHQARAFFDHEDWMALGTVSGSWQETSASLNGLAYVPNGFTQADIEQNLLKAYAGFYTRPSKIIELTSSIQRRADVHRRHQLLEPRPLPQPLLRPQLLQAARLLRPRLAPPAHRLLRPPRHRAQRRARVRLRLRRRPRQDDALPLRREELQEAPLLSGAASGCVESVHVRRRPGARQRRSF